MKRALVFLVACSGRPLDPPAPDAGPPPIVSCETASTCTLECNTPSTWTTSSCDDVHASACVDSHERSTAYGCALECNHVTRVVASCDDTK